MRGMEPATNRGTLPYRALVCVTTCERLGNLLRYLPHYAAFCERDPRFELVVALDGCDAEYLRFCEEWGVALVYADRREGVGLSKNRVLRCFPDYDYYFMIDDDVELADGSVFPEHVQLSRESGIHHFSLFEPRGVRKPIGESRVRGRRIVHGLFGGAQFNFFTRAGLEQVGGWHARFADFRRWGHTEHSYRFFHSGLAPAPFNVAVELADRLIWHYPPPVTRSVQVEIDADQIPRFERELMGERLRHHPVETLSPYHRNGMAPGGAAKLAGALRGGERYPLVPRAERSHCWSDYNLWRYRVGATIRERWTALFFAVRWWPSNPAIRTALKNALTRPP